MKTVVTQFIEQAILHPDNIAILDIRGTYTYEQMNKRSAVLAGEIRKSIENSNKIGRIALYLPRTKEYIIALFAVLRAGCAAVPIDGEYPKERVQAIIRDVGCPLVITTDEKSSYVEGTKAMILKNVLSDDIDEQEIDTGIDLSDPDKEGFILYTSGSTGKPKGVVHRQAMLNNTPEVFKQITNITEKSRSMSIAGFSFIASTFDTMPLLTAGGSVYIANEIERKNIDLVHKLIEKRQITGMYIPPQMFSVMRQLHGPLPLDYVAMVGEKFVNNDTVNDKGVVEFFGASETGTAILMHRLGEGNALSLGRPVNGVTAYLIDTNGNVINQPGIIGELCVTTPWLALGYNNLPEETAKKFTDNPYLPGERMYHTGDQMEWDENGTLIFHGRNDRMVKVRGYRIELGEIDQVIRKKEGIGEVANVNVNVRGGDLICCYYTGTETSPDELKEYASKWLPEYMIPEYFIHLDVMPRNDRGKFDYPTLKALEIKSSDAEYEPPINDLEAKICEAYAKTLNMDRTGATADFFDCGGTSLSAAVLISFLSDDKTTLSFQDISAHPTPRELAAFLESKSNVEKPAMDREKYPLTKTQMGIYLESLTGGNKATYTLPYMARAVEGVTAEDLVSAAQKVIDGHTGMKYVIHADSNGMPSAIPAADAKIDIPVFDGTEEDRMKFFREFVPIVPMMDSIMIHLAVYRTPVRCYLAIKTHLIYFDASAISLFISEINRALVGKELIGEDFTVQQAAIYEERLMLDGSHEKAKDYYLNLFKDAEDVPALSGDINGVLTPGVSENYRYEPGNLSVETVKEFCNRIHISENSFFQGAMSILLGKYLNSKYVSFSTVYNGRPLGEMANTIGTLIKRIPIFGNLSKNISVEEYLHNISRQIFNSMANDIYSFDEVLKTCPVNEDVEFIFQGDLFTDRMGRGADDYLLQGDKWFMEHYHTGMVTGCMSIQFFSSNGLYNATIEYRNEKFTEQWVNRFAQDLFSVAQGLLSAENISDISLLTDDDKKLLNTFNDTYIPIPFNPVHEQIHNHALATPDKTAVTAAGKSLSFSELDTLSNQLAKILRNNGARNNKLIGVLFDREVWAYVAEIGILKSGAAFVPFITEYPDDRIDFCMHDADSDILLTTKKQIKDRKLNTDSYRILTFEEIFGVEDLQDISADISYNTFETVPVSSDDLAYCIYTSGSTGRPKGVMIEHKNIANYVNKNEKSIEIIHYAAPGRINLAIASFSFDVSVVEEFVPLCNGNTVVIATEDEIHNPQEFARLINESGANGITCTPTYLLSLLEIPVSREAIRNLTFFDIGAEAFPRQLYDRLRELREDSVILNVYGPTECTMGCSAVIMTGEEQVTVGPPIANTSFYVSDQLGNELPVGIKGELIICGDQVGRGYVKLPEKTSEAFFTHNGMRAYHSGDLASWTQKGEIRIFGRLDNQIKLRGFRIELDEIEKVITEFPNISSSAAMVRKKGGTEYLAGYFTSKAEISVEELKQFLQEKLPEYMVPNVLTALPEMPMTSNSKVNKKALPEPDIEELKAEYIPPATETECKICEAFATTLKIDKDKVGLQDDFFDLGGDSLKAMVAISEANLEGLTAADVFQLRTPGAIAEALKKREKRESLDEREAKARLVPHNLSALQIQMIDNQLFKPQSTMWSNMHLLVRFGEEVDADRLCDAINKALKNHPSLSVAFFFDENDELKQQYIPGLLPEIKVHDILPQTEENLGDILLVPFHKILNSCLCKVGVFRGQKGSYMFFDVHHLLMDGGSLGVVMADIMNAYFGREMKKDYYFAFLDEQDQLEKDGTKERDHKYFIENYGDESWCVIPKPDYESKNINQSGRMHRLSFTAEQVKEAEDYWGVSHSVMAISAGLLALSRFTGEKNVMINWIYNNRLTIETENNVGMLIRNIPASARMEDYVNVHELLKSVKEQVTEGIAHCSWDFMSQDRQPYVNDCMEVNLQLGINADELDELPHEMLELADEFSAAGARLEMELLENEFGDGGFDSEMEYAEGLFDKARIEGFHDMYINILENLVKKEEIKL